MDISEDNISGAAVLTERALTSLYKMAEKEYSSPEEFFTALRRECSTIVQSHRSMISLQNELYLIIKAAEREETLEEMIPSVKRKISERLQFLKKAEANIVHYGSTLIKEDSTVLTHSRSSIVEKILIYAYERVHFSIIVTESRPNFEGRLLAECFNRKGISVTFIVDAAVTLFNPDLVLVGADSVTPRFVINKIGTKFLATLFPTFVACTTNKFTRSNITIEEEDPQEVLKGKYENINVKNYYFDGTPLNLMKGFITEYGILTPEKVRSLLL
jgi:translation initiation factor eIF-2B subunit delta